MIETNEGGVQHEFSLDHAVEFFSKAGSLFKNRKSFYSQEESVLSLFQKVWVVDKEIAFKLLLWLRDVRGGAGNRSGFRECLSWLSSIDPSWVAVNINWLPEVGRWDDLKSLFGTSVEQAAVNIWVTALRENNVLAAKWADRKDKSLKHALGFKEEGKFRKFLARLRKEHIVEHKMSTNRWNEIMYHTIPSLAMARYTNAFNKHDSKRFENYKEGLISGKETIHSDVLFPHDCVRTVHFGDEQIANAQFDALPNYMESCNERAIVISDTSGSMSNVVSGSVRAIDISQGMALYCSSKISKNNPFYKKFIGFCSEGSFKNWDGLTFSEAIKDRNIFDGAIGSTRIDKALDLILSTAKFFNLTNDQIPTTLIIVSDMQFHSGGVAGKETEVNQALKRWGNAGYNIPKIVYWNTAGYAGSPELVIAKNVALVSGFSPAILKAIFTGEDLTPKGVMLKALEKYTIKVPK